jgi:mono/diheme cytochrome c family protein
MKRSILVCRLALAGLFAVVATVPARAEGNPERGAYFAAISDCGGCHTPGAMTPEPDKTRPMAGNDIGFALPGLGIFYPPNLTSDMATGLGGWSDDEIAHAIRTGERPDGRILAPIMPWHAYAAYTDADMADLIAYLRSLPVVEHQVPGPFGPDETPPAPYMAFVFPE